MKTIRIGEQEYQMEFTFEAAEHKGLVQSMYRILSGSYLVDGGDRAQDGGKKSTAAAMMEGVGEMVSEMPQICKTAFYAGLLEHHRVTEEQAKQLMRQYMKENELNYIDLYGQIRECMETDGFFGLSGLTGMLKRMGAAAGQTRKEAGPKSQISTN